MRLKGIKQDLQTLSWLRSLRNYTQPSFAGKVMKLPTFCHISDWCLISGGGGGGGGGGGAFSLRVVPAVLSFLIWL